MVMLKTKKTIEKSSPHCYKNMTTMMASFTPMLACSNNKSKQKITIYLMRTLLACGYERKQEKGLGSLMFGQIIANTNLS
jgi:hypothetical protein